MEDADRNLNDHEPITSLQSAADTIIRPRSARIEALPVVEEDDEEYDLLANFKVPEVDCRTWLRGFLEGRGWVPAREIVDAGEAEGYHRAAVGRAKRAIGVMHVKQGFQGANLWKL